MRLLLDEMIGPRVAEGLRERGIDAVGVVERTDLRSLPDDAVLEFAREDKRAVVTRNIADFARLHHQWQADGRSHQGMVMVTEHAFPQDRNLVGALVQALAQSEKQAELPAPGELLYLQPFSRTD